VQALACGSNLSLVPDSTALLSALNMMSPDCTCYSFDERANGYSRSEGFGVVLLKRLSRAIDDGDTIRAIIRSTGCNQDGHTPGITQPSQAAQERLTRETYQRAGLDLNVTRYFEAHGTGTMLGDPTEACAISDAFTARTAEDPLYVGALKSNIGHPEAASGIAGIIKTVLVLEAGVIPPNRYPERINPAIAAKCINLKFPLEATPWPTGDVRRASVSSFGYGGTNVHVVLDDVLSYTESQKLSANHRTRLIIQPCESHASSSAYTQESTATQSNGARSHEDDLDQEHDVEATELAGVDLQISAPGVAAHKLLILSAFDEHAAKRSASAHGKWLTNHDVSNDTLADLAFTLASKRSSFPWRTFSVTLPGSLTDLSWSEPARLRHDLRLCFVFTGQGAQWPSMGRELYKYEAFRTSIVEADIYFKSLGSRWSLRGESFHVDNRNQYF
jgi:acyl transferase domain-containing protein